MNKLLIILIAVLCLGLTPAERKLVVAARDKAKQSQVEYDKANRSAIEAWDYATKADLNAWATEEKIKPLEADIQKSHDNEQRLGNLVQKYEPFYIQGHRWWGIGGIIQGIGILATHLLILLSVIIILMVILWLVSMTPWGAILKIPVQIVGRFLRALRDKIFKKK